MNNNDAQTSRRLSTFEWDRRYSTSSGDLVDRFYRPALDRSVRYDRAVGYFRSTIYLLTGPEIARFALQEGTMRIVCSPTLGADDAGVIGAAVSGGEIDEASLLADLARAASDPDIVSHLAVLAALLDLQRLEIRFAFRPDGIFHDKVGVFYDESDERISFGGSINETWKAWSASANHESFEVFLDWHDGDKERVAAHVSFFEQVWDGLLPGVTTVDAPTAFLEQLIKTSTEDPSEVLEHRAAQKVQRSAALSVVSGPHLPPPAKRDLFPHQALGVENWIGNGNRGLLKHATGSGKTVTGLAACRRWLKQGGKCLILVPSVLLLDQWIDETYEELADLDVAILPAGGGHGGWQSHLRSFTEPGNGAICVTIATMQTAASPNFQKFLQGGDHLLVVADEVHRIGSPRNQVLLDIDAGGRLGLSATPERYGDSEGTDAIWSYFGSILEPEFGIEEAISTGRLTPYAYYPSSVRLTDDEEEAWLAITSTIRQRLAMCPPDTAFRNLPPDLQMMILNRARIAKRAAMKPSFAVDVLEKNYVKGQHWLVYCEDKDQLQQVRQEARDANIRTLEFHTGMEGDGPTTLEIFSREGGILAAIRCLDEGVDIPAISHAIILASSRNPREFIQRRGRVLRKYPGKSVASIYDALVDPPEPSTDDSLTVGELARAHEFAKFATNTSAITEIERIASGWGISPDEMNPRDGLEADDEQ